MALFRELILRHYDTTMPLLSCYECKLTTSPLCAAETRWLWPLSTVRRASTPASSSSACSASWPSRKACQSLMWPLEVGHVDILWRAVTKEYDLVTCFRCTHEKNYCKYVVFNVNSGTCNHSHYLYIVRSIGSSVWVETRFMCLLAHERL